MKISTVLYDGEYLASSDFSDLEFERITHDLRDTDSTCLFFLIRGVKFDTLSLLPEIISKAPVAIVADTIPDGLKTEIPIIRVENARRALSFAYSRICGIDYNKTKIIGVTGTNGKTTTATMIYRAFIEDGRRVGFIGTGKILLNGEKLTDNCYSMTTPDPEILYPTIKKMQNEGCELIVMEVSSHALALEKCAPISFMLGIFTNLSAEHLDFHRDMEGYREAKLKLFNNSKIGIFNADDPHTESMIRDSSCAVIRVGAVWDAEVLARKIEDFGLSGVRYLYSAEGLSFFVKLKIIGIYNVYNSMLALTAAIAAGIKPCVAKRAIARIDRIDGRGEIIRDEITVIIDYAHTAAALEGILKTAVSSRKKQSSIITVFGCGGERDKKKRPEMGRVAEALSDFVIITADNCRSESPEDIACDILKGMNDKSKVTVILNREMAIEHAIGMAKSGDTVLVIGKGHERYNIDSQGLHEFDERNIIANALKKRKEGHNNKYENTT